MGMLLRDLVISHLVLTGAGSRALRTRCRAADIRKSDHIDSQLSWADERSVGGRSDPLPPKPVIPSDVEQARCFAVDSCVASVARKGRLPNSYAWNGDGYTLFVWEKRCEEASMKSFLIVSAFLGLTSAAWADQACTPPTADVVSRIPGIIAHEGAQPYPCSRVLSACQERPGVLTAICPEARYIITRVSDRQISVSPIDRDAKVINLH